MSNLKLQDHDAQLGVTTTLHVTESKVAIQKTWDADPFIEVAKDMRTATAGERWGDARHVGFIPPAIFGQFLRQDGGFDKKRCIEWLRQNPAFVTFDKALK